MSSSSSSSSSPPPAGYGTLGTAVLTLVAASAVGICTGWITYQYHRVRDEEKSSSSTPSSSSSSSTTTTSQQYITALQLDGHPEGGYYKRIWESQSRIQKSTNIHPTTSTYLQATSTSSDTIPSSSAIYYLLTSQSPISHFHRNSECDLLDVYVDGNVPVTFLLISSHGEMTSYVLGPDLTKGHQRHVVVPAGTWKSNELIDPSSSSSSFALMCESVSPAFTWQQHSFLTYDEVSHMFPQHLSRIQHLIKRQDEHDDDDAKYPHSQPSNSTQPIHYHAHATVSGTFPRPDIFTDVYPCPVDDDDRA